MTIKFLFFKKRVLQNLSNNEYKLDKLLVKAESKGFKRGENSSANKGDKTKWVCTA